MQMRDFLFLTVFRRMEPITRGETLVIVFLDHHAPPGSFGNAAGSARIRNYR